MPTYALALRDGESVAVEFPHDAYECQACALHLHAARASLLALRAC